MKKAILLLLLLALILMNAGAYATDSWVCPGCGRIVFTPYCSYCGPVTRKSVTEAKPLFGFGNMTIEEFDEAAEQLSADSQSWNEQNVPWSWADISPFPHFVTDHWSYLMDSPIYYQNNGSQYTIDYSAFDDYIRAFAPDSSDIVVWYHTIENGKECYRIIDVEETQRGIFTFSLPDGGSIRDVYAFIRYYWDQIGSSSWREALAVFPPLAKENASVNDFSVTITMEKDGLEFRWSHGDFGGLEASEINDDLITVLKSIDGCQKWRLHYSWRDLNAGPKSILFN